MNIDEIRNQIEAFHSDANEAVAKNDQTILSSVYSNGTTLLSDINNCINPKMERMRRFMINYGNNIAESHDEKQSSNRLFEDGKALYTNMMYIMASMIIVMLFLVVFIVHFSSKTAVKAVRGINIPRIPFLDSASSS